MASYQIPLLTDEHYDLEIDLDDVIYTLLFQWNHRGQSWFLSISKLDGTPVVSGVRVVADTPLLRYCSHPDKPKGELVALDTSGAGQDPGLTDFGSRVLLMYESAT